MTLLETMMSPVWAWAATAAIGYGLTILLIMVLVMTLLETMMSPVWAWAPTAAIGYGLTILLIMVLVMTLLETMMSPVWAWAATAAIGYGLTLFEPYIRGVIIVIQYGAFLSHYTDTLSLMLPCHVTDMSLATDILTCYWHTAMLLPIDTLAHWHVTAYWNTGTLTCCWHTDTLLLTDTLAHWWWV